MRQLFVGERSLILELLGERMKFTPITSVIASQYGLARLIPIMRVLAYFRAGGPMLALKR